jgi:hypothetical protein
VLWVLDDDIRGVGVREREHVGVRAMSVCVCVCALLWHGGDWRYQ